MPLIVDLADTGLPELRGVFGVEIILRHVHQFRSDLALSGGRVRPVVRLCDVAVDGRVAVFLAVSRGFVISGGERSRLHGKLATWSNDKTGPTNPGGKVRKGHPPEGAVSRRSPTSQRVRSARAARRATDVQPPR